MAKVVGIRFRESGKTYRFLPGNLNLHIQDLVVVETSEGVAIASVSEEIMDMPEDMLHKPLKEILRKADQNDFRIYEENKKIEEEAFKLGLEKISQRNLEMSLVDVECSYDKSKIVFYFTADGRIDFRELVRDLASSLRARIELRQIGVRDEARMVGGLGVCGRELCCCSFLSDFVPVTIKMAKEQNLSMNPSKISGACGRLLCCLNYEQEAYKFAKRKMPKIGSDVKTKMGMGKVVNYNLLKETVDVRLDADGDAEIESFPLEELVF